MADLEIGVQDGVQVLRLARPQKKNALTDAMYGALTDALERGDADPAVHAHVFLGSAGVFTAGNDIADFLATALAGNGGRVELQAIRFVRALPRVEKPMIAAVDGPAVGVGTTLLMHCDLVYASPGAVFSTPFLDLGLVPEAGSSLLAPRIMGYVRAFELLVLGEPFSAEHAKAAGLVNEILPAHGLEDVAMKAARRLALKPPEALRQARQLLRGDPAPVVRRIEEELAIFAQRLVSAEAREAFRAFLEKRAPDFAAVRNGR